MATVRTEELKKLAEIVSLSRKRVIVVSGPDGVGKSSLLSLCAIQASRDPSNAITKVTLPPVKDPAMLCYLIMMSLPGVVENGSLKKQKDAIRSIIMEPGRTHHEKLLRSLRSISNSIGRERKLLILVDTTEKRVTTGLAPVVEHIPHNIKLIFAAEELDEEVTAKADVLPLKPLPVPQISEIARASANGLPEEVVAQVINNANGSPLYVAAAMRFLSRTEAQDSLPNELDRIYEVLCSGIKSERADVLDALCFSPLGVEPKAIALVTELDIDYVEKALADPSLSVLTIKDPEREERVRLFHCSLGEAVKKMMTPARRSAFNVLFAQYYADRLVESITKDELDLEAIALQSEHIAGISDPQAYSRQFALTHKIRHTLGLYHQLAADYKTLLDFAAKGLVQIRKETCLANLGMVYTEMGDLKSAQESMEAALELARQSNDKAVQATQLAQLGDISERKGDFSTALGFFTEALKLDTELKNQEAIASDLNHLANICLRMARHKQALAFFTQALQLHTKANNEEGVANQHVGLGQTYVATGDFQKGFQHFSEARKLDAKLRRLSAEASDLANMAECLARLDRAAEAVKYLLEAVDLSGSVGDAETQCSCLRKLAKLQISLSQAGTAAQTIKRTLETLAKCSDPSLSQEIAEELSQFAAQIKDVDAEAAAIQFGIVAADETGQADKAAKLRSRLIGLLRRAGRTQQAEDILRKSIAAHRKENNTPAVIADMKALIEMLMEAGRRDEAIQLASEASEISRHAQLGTTSSMPKVTPRTTAAHTAPAPSHTATAQAPPAETHTPVAPPAGDVLAKVTNLSHRFERLITELEQCKKELDELRRLLPKENQ